MASPLFPDPMQMWREAIATFEKQLNTAANKSMSSPEFTAALHQFAGLFMGMHQTYEKLLATYLKQLNLPSQREVAELAAAIQRIEGKLDQLVAAGTNAPSVPRPARTRRPEGSAEKAAGKAPPMRGRRSGA